MQASFMHILDNVNIYTKDTRCIGVSLNQAVVDSFGLASPADYIGRSDMDLPMQADYAPAWMENDRRIMTTGIAESLIEVCNCAGNIIYFRSNKMPVFGQNGKIIGVTGFSVPIDKNCLIPLSSQQTNCLKLLALGMTYKQIATELGLSAKTVEHYIDAIKLKLNYKTRHELVTHAFGRGLIGFV